MKIKPILKAANLLVRIVGMGVIHGILMIQMTFAAGPVWWLDRGVYQIDSGTGLPKAAIDFNAVNVGQLKHFARKAYDELKENVEASVWATSEGQALEDLIKSWYEDPVTLNTPKSTSKDFALLSQGQLKNVARQFYDILHLQGVDVSQATAGQTYPWSNLSDDDKSYAPLTSGQLKQVFSFNLDTDDDGIPDWWESKIVSANGSDAIGSNVNVSGSADFDNDGFTNLQEYQEGTSATSYTSSVPSSGLKVWSQGDAGITTSGSGVTAWQNQSTSGSGFNFSGHASDTSRHPGVAYDANTRRNVIRFNGTDQYLKGPDIGTHDIKNDFTAFFVARPDVTHDIDTVATTGTDGKGSPHKRYLYFGDALNDNDAQVALSVGTNGVSIYENFNVSGSQVMPARAVLNAGTNGISPNSTFDIIEMNYASKAPSISIDGQTPTTGSAFSGRNNAYFGKSLGGPETYSTDYGYFDGDVAEVIVYNRVLNSIERQNVLNHLRLRWMDTDNDGLTDGWEVANSFDPNDIHSADPANTVSDGSYDTDGDGFTNRREFELGSNPRNAENNLDVVTIGRWKLDEGSGTLAGDSSGKDNHGIISEGATWTTGMDNSKALSLAGAQTVGVLDASDAELDLGANPNFTVSFWFKTTGTGVQRVVGKGDAFDQWSNGFAAGVGLMGAGKVGLRLGGGGTQANSLQFATTDTFNDGAWHHATIVVDRQTEKGHIYVDGVAKNLAKTTGTGGTVTTTQISTTGLSALNGTSTQKMYFGGRPGSSEFFTGSVDDIRILNQPLQSAEVLALYTQVDGDQDGMPNWWEVAHGLNPASNADKTTDLDADGITNINEFKNGTNPIQVARPVIAKASGAYPVRFDVAVTSATSGATIRYTTNGSDPTETSPVVPSGGVAVNWNMNLKAKAFKEGKEASEVASADYTLTGAVAAGYNHTLLLRTDTKMMGWGTNSNKQVSNGVSVNTIKVPTSIAELNSYSLQAIAAGTDHSIGLLTDGTVLAWGANNYRQSGATSGNTTPARIQSVAGGNLGAGSYPIVQVSAGANFNAALRSDQTVWTWGANSAGHLGIDDNTNYPDPPPPKHQAHQVKNSNTPTYLDDIVRIATGESFTIALDEDGTVWSWGSNARGQLGINSTANKDIAQHISSSSLDDIVDVGTGNDAAFAIKDIDGNPANYELYGWGDHTYYELGVNSTANVIDVPTRVVLHGNTPVAPLKGVVAVVGGENHTIALKHDGTVWGWGLANHGRIGYTQGEDLDDVYLNSTHYPVRRYPAPVKINATTVLDDVVWIGAGQTYSVALKRDGSVVIFGYNDQSQHGNGTTATTNLKLSGKLSWHTLADSSDLEDGDNDGYADAFEIANGSDPADANALDDGPTEAPAIPVPTFVVDENGGADFSTIREALQAVETEYAIILVEPGTYYGPITLEGHKILLKSTKGASETIIDAVQEAPAVKILTDSVINGFTIKNAFGDKNGMTDTGGAIYVDGCRPIIDRCYVTANRALKGAVMFNNAGMPIIRSSTMAFNKSVDSTGGSSQGAAIYSKGFQPLIQNCILFNDTTGEVGGDITYQVGTTSIAYLGATVQGSVVKDSTEMDGEFPTAPFVPGGNKLVTTNTNTSGSLKLLASGHLVSGSAAIGVGSSELPRIADVDGEVKSSGDPAAGVDEYIDSESVQGGEGLPDWWEKENEEVFANGTTPLSPTLDDADVAVNAESVTAQSAYDTFVSNALSESETLVFENNPPNTVVEINDVELGADSSGMKAVGTWATGTTDAGKRGSSYRTSMNGSEYMEFIPNLPDSGSYKVAMWWPKGDYNKEAEINVHTATGIYPLKVNQSRESNSWRDLGIFAFNKGVAQTSELVQKVVIKVPAGATKSVVADAVQFTKVSPAVELRTAVPSASNIDGTYVASKTGSKSHWGVRNIASITGTNTSKVRISRNTSGEFRFKPKLKVAGRYKVYMRWQHLQKSNGTKFYNATSVPVDVVHTSSTTTVTVNQTQNRGEWVLLSTTGNPTGVYEFPASDPGDTTAPQVVVRVPSGLSSTTWVTADAVRFEKVSDEGVIVDDWDRGTNFPLFGAWKQKKADEFSKKPSGFGRGYHILSGTPWESDQFEYMARVSKPGNYGVYVYGPTGKTHSANAVVNVNGQEMTYSQRVGGERWRPLGEVNISGTEAIIQMRRTDSSTNANNTKLIADAVALVRDPDNDHDGLVDAWEQQWKEGSEDFFRTDRADQDYNEQVDGLDDFDGDGITNAEEALAGSDPLDAYNGDDMEIQLISGDRISGEPNTIVGPLRVRVLDENEDFRVNAPVTFSLPDNNGPPAGSGFGISPTWGFSGDGKITVRTDYEGYAEVYVCLPEYGGVDLPITVQAGSITASAKTFQLGVNGLASRWSLDEMTGTLVKDSSGFTRDGSVTTTGAEWSSAGEQIWRKAIRFTSSSGKISIVNGNYGVLPQNTSTIKQAYSMAFWFRPETSSTSYIPIMSQALASGSIQVGTKADSTNGAVKVYVSRPSGGSQEYLTTSGTVPLNQWSHVIVTNDGTTVRLHVNGNIIGSLTNNWATGGLGAHTSNVEFGGTSYVGSVDEIRVYRGAIGYEEIINLFSTDSDGDGMSNDWEVANGLDMLDAADAVADADGDEVTNLGEFRLQTNPHVTETSAGILDGSGDTDSDGMSDGWEANRGLVHTQDDAYDDLDGDLYPNIFEFVQDKDPKDAAEFPVADFTVEKNGIYPTIGSAVAKLASDYQIIKVNPGTYAESVDAPAATKRFLLISSEGARKTIIDGTGQTDGAETPQYVPVLRIATNAVIAGFEIKGGSSQTGGGVKVSGTAKVRLINNYIHSNKATTTAAQGAAIWAGDTSSVRVVHSTIANNDNAAAVSSDSAIWAASGASIKLISSISWNPNTTTEIVAQPQVTAEYSCIRNGLTGYGSSNNISTDPKLTPDGHLKADSPARDVSGLPLSIAADWDNELRGSNLVDLGVDEFVDTDGDGAPDFWEEENGFDPEDAKDGVWDADGDDVTNAAEYAAGTSPWGGADPYELEPDSDYDNTGIKVVGSTPGEITVGADGSSGYNVPLFIPKGTGNMEPKLGLAYSSNAGTGSMGLGWSLTGLSTISRGGTTIAQDGVVKGVNIDNNDQFYLDGQRLIRHKNGPSSSDNYFAGSEYDTEIRSYAKITYSPPSPPTPPYDANYYSGKWVMETKNGLTMVFKPVISTTSGTPMVWGVDRVTDDKGNYFTVSYLSSGEPDKISYTGNINTGLVPYNEVRFVYNNSRVDKKVSYLGGVQVWQKRLLTKIEMHATTGSGTDKAIAREYRLFYRYSGSTNASNTSTPNGRARMVRLLELGAVISGQERQSFHDLYFDWQGWRDTDRGWQSASGWNVPKLLANKRGSTGVMFMDVNADGFPDMIWNKHEYDDEDENVYDKGAYLNPGRPGTSWTSAPQFAPPYPLIAEGGGDTGARFVDANGDGLEDLLGKGEYVVRKEDGEPGDRFTKERISTSNSGIWALNPRKGWVKKSSALPANVKIANVSNWVPDESKAMHFQDLDGDGLTEVFASTGGATTIHRFVGWSLKPAGPTSTLASLVGINHGFTDLTGDGLPEMIFNYKNTNNTYNGYYSFSKAPGATQWGLTEINVNVTFPETDNAYKDAGGRFLDLNGDGMADYWEARRGASTEAKLATGIKESGWWQYTGATLTDYFDFSVPSGVILSQADGDTDNRAVDMGNRFTDLNGDGLTDLMVARNHHITGSSVKTYLNTGTGFQESNAWKLPNPGVQHYFAETEEGEDDQHRNIATGVQIIDINADGFTDVVQSRQFLDEGPEFKSVYLNKAKPQKIVQVRNGNGCLTRVSYKPLTNPSVYTNNIGAVYPAQDVVAPIYVVERVQKDDGLGKMLKTRYRYSGLQTDLEGRGSRGFLTMESIDENRKIATKTTYHQKYPLRGSIQKTVTRIITPGAAKDIIIGRTDNVWNSVTRNASTQRADGNYFAFSYPYLAKSTVESFDLRGNELSSTTSTYEYDFQHETSFANCYGNLLRGTVDSGVGAKTTTNTYHSDPESRWKGRLASTTVKHQANKDNTHHVGSEEIVRTSGFTYEGTNHTGRLKSETPEPDRTDTATTTYTYDEYGNVTETETVGKDLTKVPSSKILNDTTKPDVMTLVERSSSTTYDTKGRFPVSAANVLGHETTSVYDQVLGVPTEVTDANGLRMATSYDTFGRVKISASVESGIENVTETNYAPYGGNSPDSIVKNVLYKVKTYQKKGSTVFPASLTWYDRLNRVIRKEAEGPDGRKIYQDTVYNNLGQVEKTSSPYFSDGSGDKPAWTTFRYDLLGRNVYTYSEDGALTYTSYEAEPGGGVKVVGTLKRYKPSGARMRIPERAKERLTTTTISNAAGQVISVADSAGKNLYYYYDATGAQTVTTQGVAYNVNGTNPTAVIIGTDIYGRKTTMTDPDKGTWEYQYNDFGELIYQKDAKGQVDFTFRDVLGRVVETLETVVTSSSNTPPDRQVLTTYDTAVRETGVSLWKGLVDKVELRVRNHATNNNFNYTSGRVTASETVVKARDTSIYDEDYGRVVQTVSEHLTSALGSTAAYATYTSSQTYDTFGRADELTYPTGVKTKNHYGQITEGGVTRETSFLDSVKRLAFTPPGSGTPTAPEQVIWKIDPSKVNARGQATEQLLGGSGSASKVVLSNSYNPINGRLMSMKAVPVIPVTEAEPNAAVQHNVYDYDLIGTVLSRTDLTDTTGKRQETFTYDQLNRLATSQVKDQAVKTYLYEDNGNIKYKPGVGTYVYGENGAGIHAVTKITLDGFGGSVQNVNYTYDANGNMLTGPVWGFSSGRIVGSGTRTITYAQNDKPLKITEPGTTVEFEYGASDALIYKKSVTSEGTRVTRYFGAYEIEVKDGVETHRHHFGTEVFTYTKNGSSHTFATNFMLKDNLGSTEVMLDADGHILMDGSNEVGRYSHDAFGARRNAVDWSDAIAKIKNALTNKGYTGHEQIDEVELIHMGGRVYDPVIGRFLSADPFIQAEMNSQSYNRYSYVQNNPLSLTDPTGYFAVEAIIAAAIVVVVAVTAVVYADEIQEWAAANPEAAQIIIAVVGVVVTVLTAGAMAAVTAGFWGAVATGAVAGAAGGFTSGTLSAAASGAKGGDILSAGLRSAAIGAVSGAVTAGLGHGFTGTLPCGCEIPNQSMAFAMGLRGAEETAVMALAHGVVQGAIGEATGGDFVSGFVSGFAGHVSGGLTSGQSLSGDSMIAVRTLIAAAIGGTASELTGGDFANGAMTAAFVHLFNQEVSLDKWAAALERRKANASRTYPADFIGPIRAQDVRSPIPTYPPGVDIYENIRIAKANGGIPIASANWFYDQVKGGGPWDYKLLTSDRQKYQAFGNFNFGATGMAVKVFSEKDLLMGAGIAQWASGTSKAEYSWKGSYWDEPIDQYWIKQGIEFYKSTRRK